MMDGVYPGGASKRMCYVEWVAGVQLGVQMHTLAHQVFDLTLVTRDSEGLYA